MKAVHPLLCIAVLFAVNACICPELFHASFIHNMGSVEGSYIAISRYTMEHWGDRLWWPLWFDGMPWQNVYQPGFHVTTAVLAELFHVSPVISYHALVAFFYCFGPVTIWVLGYAFTRSAIYPFFAALLYSAFSFSVILYVVRHDIAGIFRPRRFQSAVHYGEGPHLAAMALAPLALLCIHRAIQRRSWRYMVLSPVIVAAILLTNWPGSVGFMLMLVAYLFSVGLRAVPSVAAICALAYGLACRWIPPSTLWTVVTASQSANGNFPFSRANLVIATAFLALMILLGFALRRASTYTRLLVFLVCFTGVVPFISDWTGFALLPQPHRWALELEIAIALAVCYPFRFLRPQILRPLCAAALILCAIQIYRDRVYAADALRPLDIAANSEYKVAAWFRDHMPDARVFVPGSDSIWMNVFTDTPQMGGCCDQAVANRESRIALFTIYSGLNAGARDAEYSIQWLKAFGAQAVAVSGPRSTEAFKPFAHPHKFDGVLPELWRDGDDAIYRVSQRPASLAHVIPKGAVVSRAPLHGLDTEPLQPYLAALDDEALPAADLRWTTRHSAHIDATLANDQLVSVQIGYHPGWHASVNGIRTPVSSDALGLMVIDSGCTGTCAIDMVYDGGREAHYARIVTWISLAALLLIPFAYRP